jgi:transposase
MAAKGTAVCALVTLAQALHAQEAMLTAAVAHALAAHPDGALLQSFPRAGTINAAQILAELGDDRARFVSAAHLAAEGGVAPVTRASGKHRSVSKRWACNERLRQALVTFAHNSRLACAWAADVYRRARARGCANAHATRIVAQAWLRILFRCWQSHTPYTAALHGGACRLAAA